MNPRCENCIRKARKIGFCRFDRQCHGHNEEGDEPKFCDGKLEHIISLPFVCDIFDDETTVSIFNRADLEALADTIRLGREHSKEEGRQEVMKALEWAFFTHVPEQDNGWRCKHNFNLLIGGIEAKLNQKPDEPAGFDIGE